MKGISSQEDYAAALLEIERLWSLVVNTPEGALLDTLVGQVETWELTHYADCFNNQTGE